MARFYGYIRAQINVSRIGGRSLQEQRSELTAFAKRQSFAFNRIYCEEREDVAEDLIERDEGRKLLDALRVGDTIVTPSLDRLFLKPDDAQIVIEFFLEKGVSLLVVDCVEPIKYLQLLTIIAAMQASALECQSLVIRRGKKRQKDKGELIGGKIPFGYRKAQPPETGLIEDDDEQKKIREAREFRRKGMSFFNIATRLSREGRRGRSVSHVTIRKILLQSEIKRDH